MAVSSRRLILVSVFVLRSQGVGIHPIERTLLGGETELPVNSRVRFPELDLLRFLAACAVMLFHYTFRGPQIHAWPASFLLLSQIFRYGYLGVNVFFILSGFVILLTAYEKDALAFTIARIVRLYPAYWLCVTLTTVAIIMCGNIGGIVTLGQY